MATQLQDLQAKRKELQATNPNATMIDARNALKPITNAPVAGQVPAITNPVGQSAPVTPTPSVHDNATAPTPTELVNRNQIQVNKNKVQSEIQAGTRPEVGQQATPAQTPAIIQQAQANQQAVTPEVPTQTEQPTQTVETPKVEAPVQTQAPTQAPTTQKTPTTVTATPTAPVISPRQTAIQQKVTGYAGKTSQQFVDLLKQGQIPSEISSQLAISNPEFQKAQQEYSVYRKNQNLVDSYKSVYNGMTGQETVEKNPLQEISDKMMALIAGNGTSYVEAFKQTIGGNEAIRTKTEALNATQAEINSKIKARDDYLKELKRNNPKASLSFLTAMAANQTQGLNEEILTLQAERDQQSADLKLETELAKGEFDAQMKDMERNQNLMQSMFNLQQSVALKQMDYAQQQNTPQFQTIGNKLYKIQNGQVIDTGVEAEPNAQFQQYGDKLYKIQGGTITEVPNVDLSKPTQVDTKPFQVGSQTYQLNPNTGKYDVISGGAEVSPAGYYGGFRITQNAGDKSPNEKDTGYNGGTPGIDFAMPENTPVMSTVTGKVTFVGEKGDYGNQIIVTDAQGNQHMFSHLNGANVQQGDTITAGQQLGLSGNTGFSTGAHLDYRVKGSNGKWENPNNYLSAYDLKSQIFDAIFNFSGGAAKVAEGEMKLMQERAKTFAEMGLTPQQAIAKYKGLNIGQGVDANIATEYLNIGDNLAKKPQGYESTISKYLNAGDQKGLNDYITRLVDADVSSLYKADAILSGDYNTGVNRTNQLVSLINKNKDKIGAFDGRVNDLIQKFSGTPDYQKIKTLLQMSQADMRKYFAGSAVTETEMKALQDFIGGTTKMNPDNLVTMLQTLTNDRTSVYQNQRNGLIPSSQQAQTPQGKWDAITSILQQAISNKPQR